MTYREQTFAERCFCDATATARCECCSRPRCAVHILDSFCSRCDKAIGRDVEAGKAMPFVLGVATSVAFTLGLLALAITASVLVGIPLGIGAGLATRRLQRRRIIKRLRGKLLTYKGELPEPSREREVGNGGTQSFGPPGGYC